MVYELTNDAAACPYILDECRHGVTVAFWLKMMSNDVTGSAYKTLVTFGNGFKAYTTQSDSQTIRLVFDSRDYRVYNHVTLSRGVWHHLAAVWRPRPANSATYLDGVIFRLREPASRDNEDDVTGMFHINVNSNELDFALGEFNLYIRAKSPGFIKAMYLSYC